MIKKILPISVFVLVIILIIILGIQNMLNKGSSQSTSSIIPTLMQGKKSNNNYVVPTGRTSQSIQPITEKEFKQKLPIIAPDFTLDYSPRMQKYVVVLPKEGTSAGYDQWLTQNQSFIPLLEGQVIIANQTIAELNEALDYAEKNKLTPEEEFKKNNDALLLMFNTLLAPMSSPQETTPIPVSTPTTSPQGENKPQTNSGNGNYIYYAQCGGAYDNYPLPIQNGEEGMLCTECNAGCGPTTAAMIISSYVDSTQTPPKVIDAMSKAGVSISCNGSYMYELYGYMSKVNGIKVSSLISLGGAGAKDAVSDFRNYIKGGWTLFVLSSHVYGGHYFWITDVTEDGKILAYDPAYGSGRPAPFNENQYDPFPYYTYAFAVKKG